MPTQLKFNAAVVLVLAAVQGTRQVKSNLTVVLGALVVFVPMRFLLPVLVPYESNKEHRGRALFTTGRQWGALVVRGMMFASGSWADAHKTKAPRLPVGVTALVEQPSPRTAQG